MAISLGPSSLSKTPSAALMTVSSLRWRVAVLACTLLAFVLRVLLLDSQSLWYDEAFTAMLAQQPLDRLLQLTASLESHPPLYMLALRVGTELWGQSDFATRFLSVIAGTLTVPAVAALGRRVATPTAGVLSGALAALSPFYIYYGQEARMYALLLLCATLALNMVMLALVRGRMRDWAAFGAIALAGVYSHYFGALLLPVAAIAALVVAVVRRHSGPITGLAVAAAVFAVGFLPWAPSVRQQWSAPPNYYQGTIAATRVVRQTLEAFGGVLTEAHNPAILSYTAAYVLLALALLGTAALVWRGRERRGWFGALVVLLALLLPAAAYVVLVQQFPKFHPRYLIEASPAYFVLAGAGLAALIEARHFFPAGRMAGVAAALLLLAGWSLALQHYFFDPADARDDWRAVAAYLQAARAPDEPVVVAAGYARPALARYYSEEAGVFNVPDRPILRLNESIDQTELEQLDTTLAGAQRLWLVSWQQEVVDAAGLLDGALAASAIEEPGLPRFQGIVLRRYRLTGEPLARTTPDHPLPANFSEQLLLRGYALKLNDKGGPLAVRLYWEAGEHIRENYKASLRLVDPERFVWGSVDLRPAGETNYTRRWAPGARFSAEFSLPVTPGAPPGEYRLELTLYEEESLSTVPASTPGQGVSPIITLTNTQLPPQPWDPAVLGGLQVIASKPAGDLQLSGFRLPEKATEAGEALELMLGWRASGSVLESPKVVLALVDAAGNVASRQEAPLLRAAGTLAWPSGGGVFLTRHRLPTPPIASGQYSVTLTLQDEGGGSLFAAGLGAVQVNGRTLRFEPPDLAQRLHSEFQNGAALVGAQLDRATAAPGDRVTVTLGWHASARIPERYKVFVHLVSSDGRVVTQDDSEPVGNTLPTVRWAPGEYILDPHALALPRDLAPGEYRLVVGLYPAPVGPPVPVDGATSVTLPMRLQVR